MTEQLAKTVTAAMADDRPQDALDALLGSDVDHDPELLWLRACCVAQLSHPLAVRVALRDLLRDHSLPDRAIADAAPRFADAVLAEDTERIASWRPIVLALYATLEEPPEVAHDTHLAWILLYRASHSLNPVPADVMRLSILARRMGRQDEAIELARAAQKHARYQEDAPTYASSTALLAALVRAEDDDGLAEEVLSHGVRELRSLDAALAEAFLGEAKRLVERWSDPV